MRAIDLPQQTSSPCPVSKLLSMPRATPEVMSAMERASVAWTCVARGATAGLIRTTTWRQTVLYLGKWVQDGTSYIIIIIPV